MIIRHLEALFSLKTNNKDFKEASHKMDTFKEKAEQVFGAASAFLAFKGFSGVIAESSESITHLARMAQFLKISSTALQELQYAASKAGVSIDTLEDSLKELQIRAVDATTGSGEAFDAFFKLKVSIKDSYGHIKKPLDLLGEIADKLQNLSTQSERLWVLDSIFGDEGAKMLNILDGGSEKLSKLKEEAKRFGTVLSPEAIKRAENYTIKLNNLKYSFIGLKNAFFDKISTPLSWLYDAISSLISWFNSLKAKSAILRVTLMGLGVVFAALTIQALKLLAPLMSLVTGPILGFVAMFGPWIALIGLAILLIEDLWVTLESGDSIIGNIYNKLFGELFSKKSLDNFTKFIDEILLYTINAFKNLPNTLWQSLKEGLGFSIENNSEKSVKKGFLNESYVPSSSSFNKNSFISNQNINVSVTAKTDADAKDIAFYTKRAVKEELDKERLNLYMGVNNYAL